MVQDTASLPFGSLTSRAQVIDNSGLRRAATKFLRISVALWSCPGLVHFRRSYHEVGCEFTSAPFKQQLNTVWTEVLACQAISVMKLIMQTVSALWRLRTMTINTGIDLTVRWVADPAHFLRRCYPAVVVSFIGLTPDAVGWCRAKRRWLCPNETVKCPVTLRPEVCNADSHVQLSRFGQSCS